MTFHVTRRWQGDESDVTVDRLREVLSELDAKDDEHPTVSLTHESEWCISAAPDGTVIFENVETGEGPWHMKHVPREGILELWITLSRGDVASVRANPWIPGYGSECE